MSAPTPETARGRSRLSGARSWRWSRSRISRGSSERFFDARARCAWSSLRVGDTVGSAALSVSERTPTLTTLATEWRDARAQEPTFKGIRWNRSIVVDSTTLDALIDQFGCPAFRQDRCRGRGATRASRAHPSASLAVVRVSPLGARLRRGPALPSSRRLAPIGSTGRPANPMSCPLRSG